jgi:hypothetical protein
MRIDLHAAGPVLGVLGGADGTKMYQKTLPSHKLLCYPPTTAIAIVKVQIGRRVYSDMEDIPCE